MSTSLTGEVRQRQRDKGVRYLYGIQGVITVHIDTTFPLGSAKEALAYLQTGKARGKIVVTIT